MPTNRSSAPDPHDLVPRGKNLSVTECKDLGLRFFHVSHAPLKSGSTLLSEDYRKRPHFELFREPLRAAFLKIPRFLSDRRLEAALEKARQAIAPQAPSRRSAIFTFVCERCAVWFRDTSRKGGVVVEASLMPSSVIFVSDLVWRNFGANVLLKDGWQDDTFPFPVQSQAEGLKRIAEAYWSGENPESIGSNSRPEALIEGGVTIRSVSSPSPPDASTLV